MTLLISSSPFTVDETIKNLQHILTERRIKIFSIFDHGGESQRLKLPLKNCQVVAFGDPMVGTNLMLLDPRVAIALPLKILVWEDAAKGTQVAYRDPATLVYDYAVSEHMPILDKMRQLLEDLVIQSTKQEIETC